MICAGCNCSSCRSRCTCHKAVSGRRTNDEEHTNQNGEEGESKGLTLFWERAAFVASVLRACTTRMTRSRGAGRDEPEGDVLGSHGGDGRQKQYLNNLLDIQNCFGLTVHTVRPVRKRVTDSPMPRSLHCNADPLRTQLSPRRSIDRFLFTQSFGHARFSRGPCWIHVHYLGEGIYY